MRIAFYAPLKWPGHPVPSGDRALARGLWEALCVAGHDVTLASRLRTFDANGDPVRQTRLSRIGARVARRLVARWQPHDLPDAWFTYHVYHKAPDWLGPAVSRALRIPYVVAEGSLAPRERTGPWAAGHAQAQTALRAADTVIFLNPRDINEVRKARGVGAASAMLAPFIDVARFAGERAPICAEPDSPVRIVTIAMMRDGAKLASYRALAASLARVVDLPWTLSIVGDGPARDTVAGAFASLAHRVTLQGAQPANGIAALLARSDLLAWPAIDEAIGVAFIEAQACGVPVVGTDSPGVAGVVAAGKTGLLAPPDDIDAFASCLRRLIADAPLRRRMSTAALDHARAHHDIHSAASHLDAILREAVHRHCIARAEASG